MGTLVFLSLDTIMSAPEEKKAASSLMHIAQSYPFNCPANESFFAPELRDRFRGVLTQKIPSNDTWDHETREAYEKALSYIGSIQSAIDKGEPMYVTYRRVQCFAVFVPRRFIDLAEEQRPRALVILAHFFAAVCQLPSIWWTGDGEGDSEPTSKREIRAISGVLPAEWQSQLIWPLDMAEIDLGLRLGPRIGVTA